MRKSIISNAKSFSFINKTIKLPNGHTGSYICVEHNGAVAIIPLISKDKVVLIRQFRPALEKYIWEIPAGSLEKNERPAECARRELIEETGYKAAKIEKIGQIYPAVGYSDEVLHIFKATDLTGTVKMPEEDEIIEPEIFTKSQIREMIKSGKIQDSKTISAFAMMGWV